MKSIRLFRFNLALPALILSLMVNTTANAQYIWQFAGDYDDIIGLYDSQNFMVEDGNRVYKYTTDGGTTMQTLGMSISSPKSLSYVEYLSATQMRAVVFTGSNYELHESTDGGATFTQLSLMLPAGMPPLNQPPQFVSFDNSESLFSCKALYNSELIPVLFRTLDGGNTWNLATADTFAFEDLYNIEIYKDGHIVAASNLPQGIEVSTDRGNTFTTVGSLPPVTSGIKMAYDGGQNLWATNIAGSQNANCYVSSDGGSTWNPWAAVPDGDNVKFTKPSNLLIFGSDDTTALSTDGGATFSTVRFTATKPAGSVWRIHVGGDQQTYYLNDGNAKLWTLGSGSGVGLSEWRSTTPLLRLFPNPASNYITIEGFSGPATIYNMNGQKAQSLNFTDGTGDISILAPGIYFIRADGSQANFIKK